MSPEELKFWEEVEALTKPPPAIEIEYRLYYNSLGEITMCSMTTDVLSAEPYLVVNKEEYEQYFNYYVVKNKLVKINKDTRYQLQIKLSNTGIAVVKGHAGLILEPNDVYNNIEYYEYRNN
jgi:hypothetical protein